MAEHQEQIELAKMSDLDDISKTINQGLDSVNEDYNELSEELYYLIDNVEMNLMNHQDYTMNMFTELNVEINQALETAHIVGLDLEKFEKKVDKDKEEMNGNLSAVNGISIEAMEKSNLNAGKIGDLTVDLTKVTSSVNDLSAEVKDLQDKMEGLDIDEIREEISKIDIEKINKNTNEAVADTTDFLMQQFEALDRTLNFRIKGVEDRLKVLEEKEE